MAIRKDQRQPTSVQLDAYNKALKLSDHVMSVCKPRDEKPNNRHIARHHAAVAHLMETACIEMGADILEANFIYVGANLDNETRAANYRERMRLQDSAKRQTFRIEHIFRMLNEVRPFADSTVDYMMGLIVETRDLLTRWRESDAAALKNLSK